MIKIYYCPVRSRRWELQPSSLFLSQRLRTVPRKEWIPRIPAVVHEVDSTARPQIVKKDNPFHSVLTKYYGLSDIPVLLNTSFNIHGEPIIESPEQALVHLNNGVVDLLVIDNYMYEVNNG